MARIDIARAYAIEAPHSIGHDQDGLPMEVRHGWLVEAMTAYGDVFAHEAGGFADRADAEHLAGRVAAAGSIDPARWAHQRAAYGSQAWEDYGEADEMALEAEEELWPVPVYSL